MPQNRLKVKKNHFLFAGTTLKVFEEVVSFAEVLRLCNFGGVLRTWFVRIPRDQRARQILFCRSDEATNSKQKICLRIQLSLVLYSAQAAQ